MIKFIKILKYELRPLDQDKFEYITKVASQELDPPSLENGQLIINADMVLYSPLRRAKNCLKRYPGTEYIQMRELREVPFDLKEMCTLDQWNKYGSEIVRRKFKKMFRDDKLPISRNKIFTEIKSVLQKCKDQKVGEIAIVSHSFRLKLIEAFIKTGGEIENKPELIEKFILDKKKTYDFGEGFEIINL